MIGRDSRAHTAAPAGQEASGNHTKTATRGYERSDSECFEGDFRVRQITALLKLLT